MGAGLGISYDAYNVETSEGILSLFGHYRGYLTKKVFSPFIGMNAGYGFVLKNEIEGITDGNGGIMLSPELGLRLGAYEKANLTVAFGYRFQSADYTREVPWINVIEYRDVTYRRFTMNIGLLFTKRCRWKNFQSIQTTHWWLVVPATAACGKNGCIASFFPPCSGCVCATRAMKTKPWRF
ncbi:MAG: hypothetical protein U5O16_20960 [Rhodococcus sp. (in: high G+C Gram-positive bacteria)]|uniref:hypothetical protein n=1 Tax=Rhodococcus sp. TaxID=1831 RepID=UPI002AD6B3A8|nr:hypothetical protein [Rhodococcus sp. (in: high G+C Gram-positive bacteria)]